jgi:phosphatidylinositol glycan class V
MTFLLIFSSHTQIALRVISGDPVVWWNVAAMAFDWGNSLESRKMTKAGKAWVWWTVIWGAVSLVLWAGHYPPA